MTKQTLDDLLGAGPLDGAVVLVRADLNVPMEDGEITDDTRIRASLPTLRELTDAGARVVLLSHLGRPGGTSDPAFSLEAAGTRLAELMDVSVRFVPHVTGSAVEAAVAAAPSGSVTLLENTRFLPGETSGAQELAASWARVGSHYVNDAFGSAHRAHASTTGLAHAVRASGGRAVAGRLMARELEALGVLLAEPERPFVAILGGAKISGKIDVIEALLPRVDRLIVGGAMANTFFRALGLEIGESLVEEDRVEVARETMERGGDRILLPIDCVVAERVAEDAATRTVARTDVGPGDRIADIGPRSTEVFARELQLAGTVFWNGPMGVFELEPFRNGTVAVALAVAEATDRGALTVIGGGDSVSAAEVAGVTERMSHVSTGGGASLEFLSGATLPGVEALSESP